MANGVFFVMIMHKRHRNPHFTGEKTEIKEKYFVQFHKRYKHSSVLRKTSKEMFGNPSENK